MRCSTKQRLILKIISLILLFYISFINIYLYFKVKPETVVGTTDGNDDMNINETIIGEDLDSKFDTWFESDNSKQLREKLVRLLHHGAQYKSLLRDYYINDTGYDEAYVDTLPLLRHVPESMTKKVAFCDEQTYSTVVPAKISIVTHYFNEPLSLVLRTIYSALLHTPPHYLQEIVVIDDGSTRPDETDLFLPLFRSLYPYVRYIRNEVPAGLIPARRQALIEGTGEYVFLVDSHVEFHERWYLPLLNITQADYKSVAVPVIDLFYHHIPKFMFYDGVKVDMNLLLNWKGTFYKGQGEPYISGAIMGGAYMISRKRLEEIDYFGRGLKGYGGENMEVGLKTWVCGGKVWTLPCSRIVHFSSRREPTNHAGRPVKPFFSYNNQILAESFFDDERMLKIARIGWGKVGELDNSAIEFNRNLFKKLNCGGVRKYYKDVMPKMEIYDDDECIGYKLTVNNKCLVFHLDKQVGKGILTVAEKCSDSYDHELFNNVRMTSRGEIRVSLQLCLDPGLSSNPASVKQCTYQGGNQKFQYDPALNRVAWNQYGLCLDINKHQQLSLSNCDSPDLAKVGFVYKNYSEALRWKGIID